MESVSWKPSCTLRTWKQRKDLILGIRSFFHTRNVLEVEVPVLSRAMGTDPHLDYFPVESLDGHPRFLTTSPEFHLKRLLAADFGDIYSLGKAFRNGETGERHNGEFTILEWYRIGFDWNALMSEVAELCRMLAGSLDTRGAQLARNPLRQITWREAYRIHCGFDPMDASLEDVKTCARQRNIPALAEATQEEWLDYLMVTAIEPQLGKDGPEFLTTYPESQAALAQVERDAEGNSWARRFELYLDGVELCNGYQELVDASEQEQRFKYDLEKRKRLGKPQPPVDEHFLEALRNGMPACSGVALGVDRLIMLLLGKERLSEVLLFPDDRA